MRCEYCGSENVEGADKCAGCGSELVATQGDTTKGAPFLYRGYMVWPEFSAAFMHDVLKYHFWLGERLVQTIEVNRDVFRQIVPEWEDGTGFLWDLFMLTQNPDQVKIIEEQNKPMPGHFRITYVANEELEYFGSLEYGEALAAISQRSRR